MKKTIVSKIGLCLILFALVLGNVALAADYVWPLSNSITPDEMNTSFGPRINRNMWDFHPGIDLPAPIGTPVFAMRGGTVHRAGPGGCQGYSSRHVVLKVSDPIDGVDMYLVYLHLSSIDTVSLIGRQITSTQCSAWDALNGAPVTQGQRLAAVGRDGAAYPHLHFEFRKGTPFQRGSVHPLRYLPYTDTANFTAPVLDRFNRLGTQMAARLLFGASSRLEGDLLRVEVDLKSGAQLLETRVVDFNDETTIKKGLNNSDGCLYVNDIGVEGYQKSNLAGDRRQDLQYGILVRNLPSECDTLVARVIDVGGNVATSAEIAVPDQTALDERVDFEDGAMPPRGWRAVTSTSGSGTTVANDPSAAVAGWGGMLSIDDSITERSTQSASIQHALPPGRFEWTAEGWFNPTALGLRPDQSIYLLYFRNGTNLSVAARIHNSAGSLVAGIIAKNPDGSRLEKDSSATITLGTWHKWRLHILRIATRETTAVLYLDDEERLRVDWDSTAFEPLTLRAGIGLSSTGATATVLTDELRLTEVPLQESSCPW